MTLTAEAAAHQIQERLRTIQGLILDLENDRQRGEKNLLTIHRILGKQNQEDRTISQQKLKTLYKMGMEDAADEETKLRQALAKIQEIRNIRNERRIQALNGNNKETIRRGVFMETLQISAQTLPLFVSKPGEKIPPLCGAIPAESNYIAKPGDMVAAFCKSVDEGEAWILAEVVSFITSQNKYEVDDIDEEQKDRHVISKCRVIPLPLMRANPETDGSALFPKGTMINALYPRTTTFYKAIVNDLPATATDKYELIFEDSTYADGYSPPFFVPQRYVIAYKPIKKLLRTIPSRK